MSKLAAQLIHQNCQHKNEWRIFQIKSKILRSTKAVIFLIFVFQTSRMEANTLLVFVMYIRGVNNEFLCSNNVYTTGAER